MTWPTSPKEVSSTGRNWRQPICISAKWHSPKTILSLCSGYSKVLPDIHPATTMLQSHQADLGPGSRMFVRRTWKLSTVTQARKMGLATGCPKGLRCTWESNRLKRSDWERGKQKAAGLKRQSCPGFISWPCCLCLHYLWQGQSYENWTFEPLVMLQHPIQELNRFGV